MKTVKKQCGFTLLELLVVIAIMGIMMAMAMGGFIDWGRGIGMDGAVRNVKSSMALTRQWAITHRKLTGIVCTNNYYVVSYTNESGVLELIGGTNFLPEGIEFKGDGGPHFFKVDGSIKGSPLVRSLIIREEKATNYLEEVIQIYPLTGRARVRK